MLTDETIKAFVQETLGCTCPEEVFKKIVCEDNVVLTDDCMLSQRINIGDRLLIYVFSVKESLKDSIDLPTLVNCGEQERKRERFQSL